MCLFVCAHGVWIEIKWFDSLWDLFGVVEFMAYFVDCLVAQIHSQMRQQSHPMFLLDHQLDRMEIVLDLIQLKMTTMKKNWKINKFN